MDIVLDKVSNIRRLGLGVILIDPNVITVESALRFGFHSTNNEAECCLKLAPDLKADGVKHYSDLALEVGQYNEQYKERE